MRSRDPGSVVNRGEALKGPTPRFTDPRAQGGSSPLKSTHCLRERGSFTNLKALVRGAGACWETLWGRKLGGTIFLISLYLSKARAHHLKNFFSFSFLFLSFFFFFCWVPSLYPTSAYSRCEYNPDALPMPHSRAPRWGGALHII